MSRRYNSDNEEEDSFEKEYLNIFKNDFLDEDDADDDYNVVEDILNHKYNYDEKPYYLSIPKKEVNDLINDANLQSVSQKPFIIKWERFIIKYISDDLYRNLSLKYRNLSLNGRGFY